MLIIYHTAIADETTDISVAQMMILYSKFRPHNDVNYKTVFAGSLKLNACDRSILRLL